MKAKNLMGKKYGDLTVIKKAESKNRRTRWTCKCSCGNEKIVYTSDLQNDKVKDCGCKTILTDKKDNTPIIIQNFLDYLKANQSKSEKTIMNYKIDLQQVLKFVIKRKKMNMSIEEVDINFIKTITSQDLISFIADLDRKGNKNSTKARKISSIKAFYKYLVVVIEVLDKNVSLKLEAPKLEQRQPTYLTLDEAKKLLDVVKNSVDEKFKERDYAIITLFLNSGLRLSELASINTDKIKDDTLSVVGKGNKERTIYLNDTSKKAIKGYLKVKKMNNFNDKKALFINRDGNRLSESSIQLLVKKYIKKAGLDNRKISVHKLRHTAATLMYKYGDVDIRALQQILGHSNISTTQIYTHVDDEKLRESVNSNPLNK